MCTAASNENNGGVFILLAMETWQNMAKKRNICVRVNTPTVSAIICTKFATTLSNTLLQRKCPLSRSTKSVGEVGREIFKKCQERRAPKLKESEGRERM